MGRRGLQDRPARDRLRHRGTRGPCTPARARSTHARSSRRSTSTALPASSSGSSTVDASSKADPGQSPGSAFDDPVLPGIGGQSPPAGTAALRAASVSVGLIGGAEPACPDGSATRCLSFRWPYRRGRARLPGRQRYALPQVPLAFSRGGPICRRRTQGVGLLLYPWRSRSLRRAGGYNAPAHVGARLRPGAIRRRAPEPGSRRRPVAAGPRGGTAVAALRLLQPRAALAPRSGRS